MTARRDGALPAGEARILFALLQHPNGLRRDQITVLTGYKRATRDAYLLRLRERGLVYSNAVFVFATTMASGVKLEPPLSVLTGPSLRQWWFERLAIGERKILEYLCEWYPSGQARDGISAATGYKRATRDAYLQRLAKYHLVEVSAAGVTASATLFGDT